MFTQKTIFAATALASALVFSAYEATSAEAEWSRVKTQPTYAVSTQTLKIKPRMTAVIGCPEGWVPAVNPVNASLKCLPNTIAVAPQPGN